MFHRKSFLVVFILFHGCFGFAESDWGKRFFKERTLALKKAGPVAMEAPPFPPPRKTVEKNPAVIMAPLEKKESPPSVKKKTRKKTPRRKKPATSRSRPMQPAKDQSQELISKAKRAQENGQLEQALRLYKLAGKIAPDSGEVREGIGQLEREMN